MKIRHFLILLQVVGVCLSVFADSSHEYETVKGALVDRAPDRLVKISCFPENAVPGAASVQYTLSDSAGNYQAKVPVFMGANFIWVESGGSRERLIRNRWSSSPKIKVKLSWVGNDRQDYDLHVNNIYGIFSMEEGGGFMDYDHRLDVTWFASTDLHSIAETVTYPQPAGGVYKIWACYCGDTGGGNYWEATRDLEITVDGPFHEKYNMHLTSCGEFWNVATFRVNADRQTGWYEVDEAGQRVMSRKSCDITNGVFPRAYMQNLTLTGPNGTNAVHLSPGQSAQFTMTGDLRLEHEDENGHYSWDTDRTIFGCFSITNNLDGGTDGAYIDDFGVLSVTNAGHYRVLSPACIIEELWDPQIGDYCYVTSDPLSIDVYAVELSMASDCNHDGIIDETDENLAKAGRPFRFWINDDNDKGDIAEDDSDIPGQSGQWNPLKGPANHEDDIVNGRSDLLDFFPVRLNISQMLKHYPITDGTVYKLRQADGALKFVYTDLTRDQAGDFLTTSNSTCGVAMNQNSYEATTIQITSDGIPLDLSFLNRIAANTNKGVLMMEAVDSSTAPLVLEIWQNGSKIWETRLAMSLSGVEDMYRKVNLRNMTNPGRQDPPMNYPDGLSNGKNVVFLHGFSVDEQAARGWHAEMFKRLYWSGSKAMFHAVTWRGDDSGPIDPLYQENVNNAFLTAPYLARYVNELSGDKILLAHSLGNMVVSSAMQDHSLNVSTYIMLDAAVATECYDPGTFNAATNSNPMLHVDWRSYQPKTWASKWHELFSVPDSRAKLTWGNRFPAVLPKAYNFYSSEDEVFEIYTNVLDVLTGVDLDFAFAFLDDTEHYSWHKQEMFKGLDGTLIHSLGATDWAGWGFHKNILGFRAYSAEEANVASNEVLVAEPVFRGNPNDIFSSQIDPAIVNEVLSKGIPALSYATGITNLLSLPAGRNYNMVSEKPVLWPRNHETYGKRWLHSDIKDVAYPYVYKIFGKIVQKGELQ